MIMIAIVLQVDNMSLLVRDLSNNQEVRVNMSGNQNISPGDRIMIFYNGAMTMSIPPQISAFAVQVLQPSVIPPTPPTPPLPQTQVRAIVVEKRTNSLLVRELNNNSLMVVNTANSRYFCNGQRVIVTYDVMTRSIPPQVNALDILPDC